jgi:hypothetical protein
MTVHALRPRTLPEAYADSDMGVECPNCQASRGDWCRRPDGHYRRTPCIKRMYAPDRLSVDATPTESTK